jgi:hypothetical protein
MTKRAFLVLAVSLAGCTTSPTVVPAGQDTYVASAENNRCSSCTSPQSRATQRATEYCLERNKTMAVKDMKNDTFNHGYGKRFTLTFSCAPSAVTTSQPQAVASEQVLAGADSQQITTLRARVATLEAILRNAPPDSAAFKNAVQELQSTNEELAKHGALK